jgi:protein-S-isoprenylcysteine O-methyltransferase Ste14
VILQPLPFAWPWFLIFWSIFTWVFSAEAKIMRGTPMTGPAPAEDRGSLRVVLFGFGLAMFAAFFFPFVAPWAAPPGHPLAWFAIGLALMVAGSLLRRHCFRVLGAFFTGAVTIQNEHRVIEVGAYRYVRHPSYTAGLLIVLGVALAGANGLGALVAFAVAWLAYWYRARVEEQALLAALGPQYARFMATRNRFIPFIP